MTMARRLDDEYRLEWQRQTRQQEQQGEVGGSLGNHETAGCDSDAKKVPRGEVHSVEALKLLQVGLSKLNVVVVTNICCWLLIEIKIVDDPMLK